MQIIDLHCDTLLKICLSNGQLSFCDAQELESNKERLRKGGVKVQCFALFPPPNLTVEQKFQAVLSQIHYFYEEVLGKNREMKQLKEWEDIDQLREGEIGAMLSLEGVDAIGDDLHKLTILYQLGIRSIGLTWNQTNYATGGASDAKGGGLTALGQKMVLFNNRHRMFTDVSHLNEQSYWDTLELAAYPIASHSNARAILDHPRNLSDEQAKAMFANGGMVNLFFSPAFVKEGRRAAITDLLRHLDHFCSLGGVDYLGIGSDFDGISIPERINQLENAAMLQNLVQELLRHYTEDQVRGFASENFMRNRPKAKDKNEITA
ncbi:dipeptidase [Brevibacillus reuszeri]|uniref:dipeptidase n=1 Tax=Brevibacillus reuszeri TaxID=54915 RepID=UPI003D1CB55B